MFRSMGSIMRRFCSSNEIGFGQADYRVSSESWLGDSSSRRENNFLASVYIGKSAAGVSFLDISTGEFLLAEGSFEYIDKLLANFNPKEVLVEKAKVVEFTEIFGSKYHVFKLDDWAYSADLGREKLETQLQASSLKGFGVEHLVFGVTAAFTLPELEVST